MSEWGKMDRPKTARAIEIGKRLGVKIKPYMMNEWTQLVDEYGIIVQGPGMKDLGDLPLSTYIEFVNMSNEDINATLASFKLGAMDWRVGSLEWNYSKMKVVNPNLKTLSIHYPFSKVTVVAPLTEIRYIPFKKSISKVSVLILQSTRLQMKDIKFFNPSEIIFSDMDVLDFSGIEGLDGGEYTSLGSIQVAKIGKIRNLASISKLKRLLSLEIRYSGISMGDLVFLKSVSAKIFLHDIEIFDDSGVIGAIKKSIEGKVQLTKEIGRLSAVRCPVTESDKLDYEKLVAEKEKIEEELENDRLRREVLHKKLKNVDEKIRTVGAKLGKAD